MPLVVFSGKTDAATIQTQPLLNTQKQYHSHNFEIYFRTNQMRQLLEVWHLTWYMYLIMETDHTVTSILVFQEILILKV